MVAGAAKCQGCRYDVAHGEVLLRDAMEALVRGGESAEERDAVRKPPGIQDDRLFGSPN